MMNIYRKFLISFSYILCIFFYAHSAFSNPYLKMATSSSDNNYYIYKTEKYYIIFDKQYEKSIDLINEKITYYFEFSEKFQKTELNDPVVVILLSDKNQISNALASLFPFVHLQIYPSGINGIDLMSHTQWLDTVFVHELTHIFQMSHSFLPYPIQKLFKTPGGIILGFLIIYPNSLLPNIFIEGDAVLKESLIHQGGRLYSGFTRALVYSQIKKYKNKKNQFIRKNLINLTPQPFSRIEKYSHGAYLFSALAEKYSHDTINKFFEKNSSTNFLFPWSYNATLSSVFNMDIDDLAHFYFKRYYAEAYLQKSSSRNTLFESAVCPHFNKHKDSVLFLVSDQKSLPSLKIYNTRTQTWISKKIDLPIGKVFKIEQTYYSRSNATIQPNVIQYSLFSEGLKPHKNFISKYVEDLIGDKALYIDVKNNLQEFKLYLNKDFYDTIHSNALFGPDGSVYYFKQKESTRTLYKNRMPVFSYKGFYGHLTEITEDGIVYFIASSPFGSSIYKYQNNEISRSSSSDTVIKAKKINNDEFIVCEISPNNYHYKIVPEEEIYDQPYFYRYNYKDKESLIPRDYRFENDPLIDHQNSENNFYLEKTEENLNFNSIEKEFSNEELIKTQQNEVSEQTRTLNSKTDNFQTEEENLLEEQNLLSNTDDSNSQIESELLSEDILAKTSSLSLKYKKYRPFKHLNFSGTNFSLGYVPITTQGAVGFNVGYSLLFTDYLQHNYFDLALSNFYLSFNRLLAQYTHRAYRLNWSLGFQYFFKQNIFSIPNFINNFMNQLPYSAYLINLNFYYPIFKKNRWSSSISMLNVFVDELLTNDHPSISFFKIQLKDKFYHHQAFNFGGLFNLSYLRKYPLEYLQNKLFTSNVFFNYSKDFRGILDELKWGANLYFLYNLGYGFYLSPLLYHSSILKGGYLPISTNLYNYWMEEVSFGENPSVRPPTSFYLQSVQNLTNHILQNLNLYSTGASYFSLGLRKDFYTPIYFKVFPISIMRFIPHINYKYIILEYPKKLKRNKTIENIGHKRNWMEWSAGAEIQTLLYYKIPISIGISAGFSYQTEWEQSKILSPYAPPFFNFYLRSNL